MKKLNGERGIVTRTMRKALHGSAAFALLGALTLNVAGCPEGDEISAEFRDAAGASLEEGVNSIADGIIDGIFALLEPDASTTSE